MFWFRYETVKFVQIRDPRLGVLRLLLLVAIAAYVGLYELYLNGGYLAAQPITGSVRFRLQQPTVDSCDPNNANCSNAFAPLSSLPYCRNAHIDTNSSASNTLPCQFYEALNAQMDVSESSMAVMTKGALYNQTLMCDGTQQASCPNTYQDDETTSFFVAQSEAFTILLEHAVTASRFCNEQHKSSHYCSTQAKDSIGRLLVPDNPLLCQEQAQLNNSYTSLLGEEPTTWSPCYIGANKTIHNQDFFSLDTLVQAAGISSLDDCTDDGTSEQECRTFRDSGATLLVTVVWSDFDEDSHSLTPHYTYSSRLIGSKFQQSTAYYTSYRSHRILLNAHGIKLVVVLQGDFHEFDWMHLLITATTAVGLLALATTIVDNTMLYVLPERERYNSLKYEQENDVVDGDGDDGDLEVSGPPAESHAPAPQEHGDSLTVPLLVASESDRE